MKLQHLKWVHKKSKFTDKNKMFAIQKKILYLYLFFAVLYISFTVYFVVNATSFSESDKNYTRPILLQIAQGKGK